jgi:hypothetical protein
MDAKYDHIPYAEEYGVSLEDLHIAFHTLSFIASTTNNLQGIIGGLRGLHGYLESALHYQQIWDMQEAQTTLSPLLQDASALVKIVAAWELRGIKPTSGGMSVDDCCSIPDIRAEATTKLRR